MKAAPHNANRTVAYWLIFCCAMIFAMVVIGGVTRLTESGLSITEWKPVTGAIPPLSEGAWQDAFAKYQQIPEYRHRNMGMTLPEFKNIFWWEFVHRLWGRLIGLVYAVPLVWFVLRGQVRGPLAWKLAGIFLLGGLQGVLGWYMVQSGLVDRVDVSPYRLTAHLGLALLIYAASLWTALDLLRPGRKEATPLARPALAFCGLAFVTMLSGGFVAGLDAGMIYNTFPLMDGRLVPAGYLDETPWWVNLFENVAAVQFNHRLLAMTTLACAIALAFAGRRAAPRVRGLAAATGGMAALQAALGIATLLLVVPIPLAAAHQAGAVLLLTLALMLAHAAHKKSMPPPAAA
ncbi:MAG TPA: COX15/CtaA family protein [Alphaproteobacteria bacterium]|nr:COX15/CtaA family protein [Alphaproteobacteria bacterium]